MEDIHDITQTVIVGTAKVFSIDEETMECNKWLIDKNSEMKVVQVDENVKTYIGCHKHELTLVGWYK